MDAIHVHVTNSLNLPVEVLENETPFICDEYSLVLDSGGAGRQRGGLGIARQIRALHDGTIASVRPDSYIHGAEGIDGGGPGGLSAITRNYGADSQENLPLKVSYLVIGTGETIRIHIPGGGGFGTPEERSLDETAPDLRDELVSQEVAERDYGTDRVKAALKLA